MAGAGRERWRESPGIAGQYGVQQRPEASRGQQRPAAREPSPQYKSATRRARRPVVQQTRETPKRIRTEPQQPKKRKRIVYQAPERRREQQLQRFKKETRAANPGWFAADQSTQRSSPRQRTREPPGSRYGTFGLVGGGQSAAARVLGAQRTDSAPFLWQGSGWDSGVPQTRTRRKDAGWSGGASWFKTDRPVRAPQRTSWQGEGWQRGAKRWGDPVVRRPRPPRAVVRRSAVIEQGDLGLHGFSRSHGQAPWQASHWLAGAESWWKPTVPALAPNTPRESPRPVWLKPVQKKEQQGPFWLRTAKQEPRAPDIAWGQETAAQWLAARIEGAAQRITHRSASFPAAGAEGVRVYPSLSARQQSGAGEEQTRPQRAAKPWGISDSGARPDISLPVTWAKLHLPYGIEQNETTQNQAAPPLGRRVAEPDDSADQIPVPEVPGRGLRSVGDTPALRLDAAARERAAELREEQMAESRGPGATEAPPLTHIAPPLHGRGLETTVHPRIGVPPPLDLEKEEVLPAKGMVKIVHPTCVGAGCADCYHTGFLWRSTQEYARSVSVESNQTTAVTLRPKETIQVTVPLFNAFVSDVPILVQGDNETREDGIYRLIREGYRDAAIGHVVGLTKSAIKFYRNRLLAQGVVVPTIKSVMGEIDRLLLLGEYTDAQIASSMHVSVGAVQDHRKVLHQEGSLLPTRLRKALIFSQEALVIPEETGRQYQHEIPREIQLIAEVLRDGRLWKNKQGAQIAAAMGIDSSNIPRFELGKYNIDPRRVFAGYRAAGVELSDEQRRYIGSLAREYSWMRTLAKRTMTLGLAIDLLHLERGETVEQFGQRIAVRAGAMSEYISDTRVPEAGRLGEMLAAYGIPRESKAARLFYLLRGNLKPLSVVTFFTITPGKEIEYLRLQRGLTQQQVAHGAGYAHDAIERFENGEPMSEQAINGVANGLEIPQGSALRRLLIVRGTGLEVSLSGADYEEILSDGRKFLFQEQVRQIRPYWLGPDLDTFNLVKKISDPYAILTTLLQRAVDTNQTMVHPETLADMVNTMQQRDTIPHNYKLYEFLRNVSHGMYTIHHPITLHTLRSARKAREMRKARK